MTGCRDRCDMMPSEMGHPSFSHAALGPMQRWLACGARSFWVRRQACTACRSLVIARSDVVLACLPTGQTSTAQLQRYRAARRWLCRPARRPACRPAWPDRQPNMTARIHSAPPAFFVRLQSKVVACATTSLAVGLHANQTTPPENLWGERLGRHHHSSMHT